MIPSPFFSSATYECDKTLKGDHELYLYLDSEISEDTEPREFDDD